MYTYIYIFVLCKCMYTCVHIFINRETCLRKAARHRYDVVCSNFLQARNRSISIYIIYIYMTISTCTRVLMYLYQVYVYIYLYIYL